MLWLHCNRCGEKPAKGQNPPFYVTDCGHIYCRPCMEVCMQNSACDACSSKDVRCVEINDRLRADVKAFFEDVKSDLSAASRASTFQVGHYKRLASELRKKVSSLQEAVAALERCRAAWREERKALHQEYRRLQTLVEARRREKAALRLPPPPSASRRHQTTSDSLMMLLPVPAPVPAPAPALTPTPADWARPAPASVYQPYQRLQRSAPETNRPLWDPARAAAAAAAAVSSGARPSSCTPVIFRRGAGDDGALANVCRAHSNGMKTVNVREKVGEWLKSM